MPLAQKITTSRIGAVDALRGFALLGILLMHCLEHFNYFVFPKVEEQRLIVSNNILASSTRFIFSEKAYAIFALLFGFSFFIQDNNQRERGKDFRARFLWRMVILFGWGCLNSIFYTGDILVLFSVLGLLLAATSRLSDKWVLAIAVVLFLMPVQWFHVIYGLADPAYVPAKPLFAQYYQLTVPVLAEGNFLDMVKGAFNGQMYSFLWWIEDGYVFKVAALFLLGMLAGRRQYFVCTRRNFNLWIKTLLVGILVYFPLKGMMEFVPQFFDNRVVMKNLHTIFSCYSSFAFLCFLVPVFLIVYYKNPFGAVLRKLEPYGKMSLTVYITQSVLGGFVFYNWGLGLLGTTTATYSLLIGLAIFVLQYAFAAIWLKFHRQGPLEYIWHKLTWLGSGKK